MKESDVEPWSGYDAMTDIDLWNLEHYPPGILKSTAIAPQSFENQKPSIPGISPVGVGTPATAKIRVSKPHIPYGTGYNLLKKTPGFSKVFNTIARDTNIVEYDYNNKKLRDYGHTRKPPKVSTARFATNSNINQADPRINNIRRYFSTPSDVSKEVHGATQGSYWHKGKLAVVPAPQFPRHIYGIPSPFGKSATSTRRHEFIHRMQEPKMNRFKKELDAYVGQNKSIRKGLQEFGPVAGGYVKAHSEAKYPHTKLKQVGETIKGKALKAIPTAVAGGASMLIPGRPGMFTGRVPSMRAVGGNLLDMFMVGPEMQKAKEDPLYGMGKDERARIEAAYEYGL